MFDKIKRFYKKHWNTVQNVCTHPGEWFKQYKESLQQKDTAGKVRQILGTVGEVLLVAALIFIAVFFCYLFLVIWLAGKLLGVGSSGTSVVQQAYIREKQAEKEDYERRTGKPF